MDRKYELLCIYRQVYNSENRRVTEKKKISSRHQNFDRSPMKEATNEKKKRLGKQYKSGDPRRKNG